MLVDADGRFVDGQDPQVRAAATQRRETAQGRIMQRPANALTLIAGMHVEPGKQALAVDQLPGDHPGRVPCAAGQQGGRAGGLQRPPLVAQGLITGKRGAEVPRIGDLHRRAMRDDQCLHIGGLGDLHTAGHRHQKPISSSERTQISVTGGAPSRQSWQTVRFAALPPAISVTGLSPIINARCGDVDIRAQAA
ncbi:hypothetical protein SDC9_159523 [bioreactor metagenome]|uniref:Uncharacterized protein n=1 Tax=bioreactor metagenome TaxID=1076179 RepID=A0A645FCY8_9ZZZZ